MTDKQEKPDAVPEPPEGFVYYGLGPLKHIPPEPDRSDIAAFVQGDDKWHVYTIIGLYGAHETWHYALRIGSAIAAANGLTNGPQNETSADTISDSGIANDWRSVAEDGWPRQEDYPLWILWEASGLVDEWVINDYDEWLDAITNNGNDRAKWLPIQRPQPPKGGAQ